MMVWEAHDDGRITSSGERFEIEPISKEYGCALYRLYDHKRKDASIHNSIDECKKSAERTMNYEGFGI